ncbi:MAG: hypothetical protein DRM99_04130 [Thermoplasmata archaeon]|nr:MAG: hypothetical protein DRM99_04130 [Thermoplasmata archaeon]
MKILFINWHDLNVAGGCESIFNNLLRIFPNSKYVSVNKAMLSLGVVFTEKPPKRFFVIDNSCFICDYIKLLYDAGFKYDAIVSNDCCLSFLDKDIEVPIITLSQNNYKWIAEKLHKMDLYDYAQFNEFGRLYTLLQKRQFDKSSTIVAVSNYVKKYISEFGDYRVKVIEHGVDTEIFNEKNKRDLREKYNIKGKKVGIWVGKFHPLKWNFMPEIIKATKDITWILVFDQVVNYKPVAKNLKLYAGVNHEILSELYNCADFFLLPSIEESFNLSAIESLACNVPIITTNVGYFYGKKGIQDFGYIVNKLNPKEFINAINVVLKKDFEPRRFVFENKLDLNSWKKRWESFLYKKDF